MWRPGRDLRESLSGVAVLVFLAAVGFIAARILIGCKPRPADGPTLPGYCYDDKLFTAAHLRCVDRAATLEESRACRRAVDESCGITETEAKKR